MGGCRSGDYGTSPNVRNTPKTGRLRNDFWRPAGGSNAPICDENPDRPSGSQYPKGRTPEEGFSAGARRRPSADSWTFSTLPTQSGPTAREITPGVRRRAPARGPRTAGGHAVAGADGLHLTSPSVPCLEIRLEATFRRRDSNLGALLILINARLGFSVIISFGFGPVEVEGILPVAFAMEFDYG